ncbi:MAG: DUF6527 family protein [Candidatus Pacebacteria bacterium]|nr:DUF6527 family protein [Candidatus Paceibacterota bacterium]MDD5356898.1 DUF6527 family protein [Candidatus Paceibacterota bacterium]
MTKLSHKFVKNIPDNPENGVLYVSIDYSTAIHKCFCGCGNEVVTPLSPTDWKLTFNGETISLYPSIGNWNFPCQSHYWIRNNEIEWAPKWSKEQVEDGREEDGKNKEIYYGKKKKKSPLFEFFFRK